MGLTTKRVARLLSRPGRYGDGHGLYLQVISPTNASWVLRYERNGRERMLGLGPQHTVKLKDARQRARAARLRLLDGIDPLEAKRTARRAKAAEEAKALTFRDAAQSYFNQHEGKWKNRKHVAQFLSTLRQYAFPVLGALPVGEIDTTAVLRVLEQRVEAERGYPAGAFWQARPETASRVRSRIEKTLDWCTVRGFRSGDNPARWRGHIAEVLPARNKIAATEHHAALPYTAIPECIAALHTREGAAARALEFTILTAARTGEVIGARWDEIDFAAATWIVPKVRMKGGREHRVPLSARAVELLRGLYREDGNDFVFIGPRPGSGLSNMAMTSVLRRMGHGDVTVHGFRSSFMDWAHERANYPKVVIDMSLAHVVGDKTEASYRRGDLLAKRKALMEAWATFCTRPPVAQGNNVTQLRGQQ